MNTAIILASGIGSRMGHGTPKQYIQIAQKPIVQYCIETFCSNKNIQKIIVVINNEHSNYIEPIINNLDSNDTLIEITNGGVKRSDSTINALKLVSGDDKILIHDSVRPFIDNEIIDNCLDQLTNFDAVNTVINSNDTIIKVDNSANQIQTLKRNELKRVQTPQGFRAAILQKAYKMYSQNPKNILTDDISVVETFLPSISIKTISGSNENFKITHKFDLEIASLIADKINKN